MPTYSCKITDQNGKTREILKEAPSEDVLILELTQKNCFPLKIREVQTETAQKFRAKAFSTKVILEFTQTMSLLLTAGLSLKDALQINKTIFTRGPLRKLVDTLVECINKGDSFHKALTRFKGSFPPIYIGLVKIGQKIGSMDSIFKKLTGYLEQNKRIKDKLGNAMAYPILILGFITVGLIALIFFGFPAIKNIFLSMGTGVSEQLTKAFSMANIFLTGGFVLLVVLAAVILTIVFIRKSESPMVENLDRIALKLPVAGKVIFTQEALNFLFAMETLTGSGYAVEDALLEASAVFQNLALKNAVEQIRERIIKGEHLSTAFLEYPVFDPRIGQWVSIGERSGNVETVFSQLKSYYQDYMDRWITKLMSLIEPAMTIGLGVIVLIMVLVFFLPIFSIYQSF